MTGLHLALRRLTLLLLAGAVGVLALGLFGPAPTLLPPAQAAAPEAPRPGTADAYDPAQLEVLRKAVIYIKDNYVDPKRIQPREMFLEALESIEKSTTEVLVEGDAKAGTAKVTVGTATREFSFKDVDSIWLIPHRIRPVFAFLHEQLPSAEKRVDLEYAAINGMLSTLDPHSWLLKPEVYKEMKLTTKGEFGGLGFVISMDEERLTVRKVLKNTPAEKAGIKKGDHITRIEDESTINIDLNEAVSKLRGKPGTEVRIYVKRGTADEKLHRLIRDLISVESVTWQPLAGGVGYVRISNFAGTTARDLDAGLRDLKARNGGRLAGLVLDLRGNPGGLYDQAVQVSDLFLKEGTIVTTAGMGDKVREPKQARDGGGELDFPVAVLVNSESASASEIVAGALKNLGRAVIIGRQTFGKGSVQVLYDFNEPVSRNEGALKLTIAQYLTPGERSIQEIGVTPDIELVPARLVADRVDLFAPPRLMREADLDKHFSNGFQPPEARPAAEATDKPVEVLRYLRPDRPAKADVDPKDVKPKEPGADPEEELDEPEGEEIARDYPVDFARELLVRSPSVERATLLSGAKAFLDERRKAEDAKIEKAVEALGVDWSAGAAKPAGISAAAVEVRTEPVRPRGGDILNLTVTVTNTGKVPLERLRGWTRCQVSRKAFQPLCNLVDRREFLFGKVLPGQKKSWTAPMKVPNHLAAALENVTLTFDEAHGNAPEDHVFEVATAEQTRPTFAFTYQVLDADGLALPGETVDVEIVARNVGTGASSKGTYVSLRNKANDKVFMKRGRIGVGEIKPGESRTATIQLEVKPGIELVDGGIPLQLEIGDRDAWEFTAGKVIIPSAASAPAVTAETGTFRPNDGEPIRAAPLATAPVLAIGRKGLALPVTARVATHFKVDLGRDRSGWIAASSGTHEKSGKAPAAKPGEPRIALSMHHEPPVVSFEGIDTQKGPLVVEAERLKLAGAASDASGLMDVRVFHDNEKVLFRTARSEPGGAKPSRMPFAAELVLRPGNNTITVVARENEDFQSQQTIVVHRRTGALAQTRKAAAP